MTLHYLSQKRQSLSRRHLILLAILLLALSIRLTYAFSSQFTPDFSDAGHYNEAANRILDDKSLIPPDKGDYYNPTKPPGYAGFISLIYRVAGRDNLRAVFVVQAVLSTLTLLLVYLIASSRFGPRPALVAVGLGAVFTDMVLYNITLMTETLALFLVVLGIWALSRLPLTRVLLAIGSLAFGISILVRPSVLFFLPGIALWIFIATQFNLRAKLAQVLLLGAFVGLPLTPWIAANIQAGNGLTNLGPGTINLWLASDPGLVEEGWPEIPRNGRTDAEIERALLREALQNIRDRPASYAQEVLLRLSSFLGANRDSGVEPLLVPTARADRLTHERYYLWKAGGSPDPNAERIIKPRWISLANHLPMAMAIFFGAIGVIYAARGSERQDWLLWLVIATYLAGIIFLSLGSLRFRLMVAPIFVIYAGYGLYLVTETIKGLRPTSFTLVMSRRLLTTCAVLGVLLVNFGFSLRGFFGGLV